MDFVLPVPRQWYYPGLGVGDWIYLAGGRETDYKDVKTFEKFNVVTGEVIKLRDLREPSYDCLVFNW